MRAIIAAMLLVPLAAEAGELSITIEGVRSPSGTVMIGLYDNAEGFRRAVEAADSKALLIEPSRYAAVALRANAAANNTMTLSQVDQGSYAVVVIHDVNNNTRLDRGWFGLPTEPYGFSNNAQTGLSAPSFADAAVAVGRSAKSIRIVLVNP